MAALLDMDDTHKQVSVGDDRGGSSRPALGDISSVVTSVGAGVGGLYLSTQSVVVTAIGTSLVAVLTLPIMLVKRSK